jgi:hypothetical protein
LWCGGEKGKQGCNCGEQVVVDHMKKEKEEEKSSEE